MSIGSGIAFVGVAAATACVAIFGGKAGLLASVCIAASGFFFAACH